MRRLVILPLALAAAVVLTACANETTPLDELPTGSPDPPNDPVPNAACYAGFETVSAMDTIQPSDLSVLVKACETPEDWVAAAEAFPEVLQGEDSLARLRDLCTDGAVADQPACRGLP